MQVWLTLGKCWFLPNFIFIENIIPILFQFLVLTQKKKKKKKDLREKNCIYETTHKCWRNLLRFLKYMIKLSFHLYFFYKLKSTSHEFFPSFHAFIKKNVDILFLFSMHFLGAHFYCRSFCELVFATPSCWRYIRCCRSDWESPSQGSPDYQWIQAPDRCTSRMGFLWEFERTILSTNPLTYQQFHMFK